MRRAFALCVLLTFAGIAYGQSLGEVARQTRQKEKSKTKTARKVITNEEIPESPDLTPAPLEAGGKKGTASAPSSGPHSAREWREAILTQRDRVETMQAQINKLNASIHFVDGNAYVNGAEYNRYQIKKQQEVKRMQTQLDEEQKKLGELQEAARKEGMGTSVYEPVE